MGNSNGKPVVFTDSVNLNHFRLLRVVGKGAFGKVRIVEKKDTNLTFALKYIRKDEVVRSESVRNIIRERRMLEHLNHPLLVNLRYSFQDIEYLYIVVDLMNGGDLRFHISRKTFTEDAVRFWIAELACAVRYVHKQGIVHRDIKPDNILLDADGHAHLADFNVASDFSPHKPLHSKSGTLAYLAPEVYEGVGYLSEVDWWSLGVLFYECIYNKRPFEANNHEGLSKAIRKADPPFPVTNPPVSMPCLHAISSLLEKNKKKRIGAAGFHTFTDNPFFRELDFEALERLEVEPVFKPSSEKTNFDATYDLEELLLEEAPLEARARRQKPREALKEGASEAEIRAEELHKMIETMFEPFDYTTVRYEKAPSGLAEEADKVLRRVSTTKPANHRNPPSTEQVHGDSNDIPTPAGTPPIPPQPDSGVSNTNTHSKRSASPRNPTPPTSTSDIPADASTTQSQSLSHVSSAPTDDRRTHSEARSGKLSKNPQGGAGGALPSHMNPGATPQRQPSADRRSPSARSGGPGGAQGQGQGAQGSQGAANYSRSARGSTRSTSVGGGVSVTLDERGTGAWSEMGAGDPGKDGGMVSPGKPSGMLGFLSRKKGRDRSPKPSKERERGVLGKEGARVVISDGR